MGALAAGVALGCSGVGDEIPARRTATVSTGRASAPVVQLHVHPTPTLFPVEPERQKEIHLDLSRAIVDLGGEGKYVGLSFGGQIPGPTLRVREGDRIRFSITNRSDEALDGLGLVTDVQSIALGGLLMDREDEGRKLPPGATLTFEATAINPGVHAYAGTLPSGQEARAGGLYGMLIVDPEGGFPGRAAREFALVQGELYAGADPAGRQLAAAPVKVLDRSALSAKRPTHLGYGGRFAPSGDHVAMTAEPGERVRLFVLNIGPNATARFQVPGVPFDRVWPAALLGDKPNPAGPATLAPGTGGVVELVIPKKGRYRLSDRGFAERGLWATIDAAQGEPEPPSAEALAALRPRTPAERRARGGELYSERCVSCHEPPPGSVRLAPSLSGLFERRPRQWLVAWLIDPPKMQAEDPIAQELMRQWNNIPMPQMMLSPEQVEWVLEFLASGPGKKG